MSRERIGERPGTISIVCTARCAPVIVQPQISAPNSNRLAPKTRGFPGVLELKAKQCSAGDKRQGMLAREKYGLDKQPNLFDLQHLLSNKIQDFNFGLGLPTSEDMSALS